MKLSRVVEYAFFFGLLGLAGYMVWLIMAPFVSALALAAIIVTICHPLYTRIRQIVPRKNKSLAAFASTMIVLIAVIIPVTIVSSLVVKEIVSFYQELETGGHSFQNSIATLESSIQTFAPGFQIDLTEQIKVTAQWLTGNLGAIFASTLSTIFVFFIAMIGSFYFFRDGKEFLQLVIKASPLPDHEDQIIFDRMGRAVRAVATGTLLVALIQGTLVAVGFSIVGLGERAILWGSIASLGALVPGVGTTIVTAPAIIYLFFTGHLVSGVILLIWSMLIVGLVDNLIGPYLISRGNNLHPFIILISVLGGISLFGPVGFVIGPVVVTLFLVLLEIYNQYIVQEKKITEEGLKEDLV
ncbi:MAG: AI-2E family transporter [Candidatus Kaiserbacteria bacterium]|nr:AI-2E family transporter [Candidatus Kaiserbacteria bacterium]MCB9815955.1 AI-2E family transporter [Candidatus Nomurabacteria bacterium]